mmetsp:Transcript_21067/g.54752  ORF Transcript_21067/g.54752 Transcript_21067/m.54752 type:complete len:688 (-) Transcript_21067:509-2572(-)
MSADAERGEGVHASTPTDDGQVESPSSASPAHALFSYSPRPHDVKGRKQTEEKKEDNKSVAGVHPLSSAPPLQAGGESGDRRKEEEGAAQSRTGSDGADGSRAGLGTTNADAVYQQEHARPPPRTAHSDRVAPIPAEDEASAFIINKLESFGFEPTVARLAFTRAGSTELNDVLDYAWMHVTELAREALGMAAESDADEDEEKDGEEEEGRREERQTAYEVDHIEVDIDGDGVVARLGESGGDIEAAASDITLYSTAQRSQIRREAIQIGVNPAFAFFLFEMGLSKGVAFKALKETNSSSVAEALDWALSFGDALEDDALMAELLMSSAAAASTLGGISPSSNLTRAANMSWYGATDDLPALSRRIDSLGMPIRQRPQQRNYTCCICLTEYPVNFVANSEGETFETRCGHRFCKECMSGYLEHAVTNGEVYPKCPFVNPSTDARCGQGIPSIDIERCVSTDTFIKYGRFKSIRENPRSRSCPKCDHVNIGHPRQPKMECEKCEAKYCYHHSDAHPPSVACRKYERTVKKTEKLSKAAVSKTSKKCPGCRAPTEKISGCNHMQCPHCRKNWCWLCGRAVDSDVFPRHFKWWNIAGCPGLQMIDGIQGGPGFVALYRFLFVFLVLLGLPFAVVGAVLFGGIFIITAPVYLSVMGHRARTGSSYSFCSRSLLMRVVKVECKSMDKYENRR